MFQFSSVTGNFGFPQMLNLDESVARRCIAAADEARAAQGAASVAPGPAALVGPKAPAPAVGAAGPKAAAGAVGAAAPKAKAPAVGAAGPKGKPSAVPKAM